MSIPVLHLSFHYVLLAVSLCATQVLCLIKPFVCMLLAPKGPCNGWDEIKRHHGMRGNDLYVIKYSNATQDM